MSLQPSNFETLNEFFTKFNHIVLLLKQCKVEKEDDQLILAILSKLGVDNSVFLSTFHAGKLTTPGWKMPTFNAFIEYLTSGDMISLSRWGSSNSRVINPSMSQGPNI